MQLLLVILTPWVKLRFSIANRLSGVFENIYLSWETSLNGLRMPESAWLIPLFERSEAGMLWSPEFELRSFCCAFPWLFDKRLFNIRIRNPVVKMYRYVIKTWLWVLDKTTLRCNFSWLFVKYFYRLEEKIKFLDL